MYAALAAVLIAAAGQSVAARVEPAASQSWVPFSADLRIAMPGRSEGWGRHLQDEHGCTRQDTIHPDGSAMISITNFQTKRFYRLFGGAWTVQEMGPQATRGPSRLTVGKRVEPIEGFDAYLHEVRVRSPRGDYIDRSIVLPALNFFRAVVTMPSGEARRAVNIRVGPQPHAEFQPPEGAAVAEQPGFGGFMSFDAVVLRIAFDGLPAIEAVTTEETAHPIRTPAGLALTLVTSVIDESEGIVRIRVLDKPTGRPGNVRGELIDQVEVALGGTGRTTKLGEPFTVIVERIRARTAVR